MSMGVIWNNMDLLSKTAHWVQILAIVLVFLGGILQLSKYALERQLSFLRSQIQEQKDKEYQEKIARLGPRKLTSQQRDVLIAKLSERRGQSVGLISRLMDGESADYADDFVSVFKKAGWNVVPTWRTSTNDSPGYLSLFVAGENLDEDAKFICKVLNELNIDCRPQNIQQNTIGGRLQSDTIYIVVGRKK